MISLAVGPGISFLFSFRALSPGPRAFALRFIRGHKLFRDGGRGAVASWLFPAMGNGLHESRLSGRLARHSANSPLRSLGFASNGDTHRASDTDQ